MHIEIPVCCSVLQCVAVCCSVLQCVAVCCNVLRCVAVWFLFQGRCVCLLRPHFWPRFWLVIRMLQCVAVCCSELQCAVVSQCDSCLKCTASAACCHPRGSHCVLQSIAACCSVLQWDSCFKCDTTATFCHPCGSHWHWHPCPRACCTPPRRRASVWLLASSALMYVCVYVWERETDRET